MTRHDDFLDGALSILPLDERERVIAELRTWLMSVWKSEGCTRSDIADFAEMEAAWRLENDDKTWRAWFAICWSLRLRDMAAEIDPEE